MNFNVQIAGNNILVSPVATVLINGAPSSQLPSMQLSTDIINENVSIFGIVSIASASATIQLQYSSANLGAYDYESAQATI